MITGSGPSDPALRRAWLATHQPYSVKTKDGWMPISNTEPGSTTLGMVADFAQIWNQLDEPTAEQAAMAFGFVVMKDLADKTYWKTVGDLIDLTASVKYGEEPGRKLKEVLMSPVTTAVTGGPLVAGAARAIDPIRREARGFFDGLVARTPGYSKALPPMRDGYGDPILPAQAVGGAWTGIVSPLSIKPFEEDRVKKEGDRLQARLPLFPWQIGGKLRDDFDIKESLPEDRIGVELTPQQRDRAMQIYRNTIRHPETGIEKSLLNNPEYPKQTRAMQREMFMNFLSDAKAQALEALQIEDVELGKKILRSDAASVKPFLQEQEQKVLEQQVQETTTLLETLAPEQQENLMRFGIMGSEE
jgi:hypothetical protein